MTYIPELFMPTMTEHERQRMQWFIAEAKEKGLDKGLKSDSKQVRRNAAKAARKVAAKWKR